VARGATDFTFPGKETCPNEHVRTSCALLTLTREHPPCVSSRRETPTRAAFTFTVSVLWCAVWRECCRAAVSCDADGCVCDLCARAPRLDMKDESQSQSDELACDESMFGVQLNKSPFLSCYTRASLKLMNQNVGRPIFAAQLKPSTQATQVTECRNVVRRVVLVALHDLFTDMAILAPPSPPPPIRTHLTRVTRVSRCTPHGTKLLTLSYPLGRPNCACDRRDACRLLIVLDTLVVRFTTSCGRRGVRLGARRCRKAQHERSPGTWLSSFLAWPGPMVRKCRVVPVSVLPCRSRRVRGACCVG